MRLRQRHLIPFFCIFAAFFAATIIATYLVMDHLRQKHKPIPFVEPVIWHEPYTGGDPRIQPDI